MSASRIAVRIPFLLLVLLFAAVFVTGCGDDDSVLGNERSSGAETEDSGDEADGGGEGFEVDEEVAARNDSYDEAPTERLEPAKTYVVHVETNKGDFDITLDQEHGPIAAANFAFLVEEGFYDGIVFHRIIKDFMIQSGDPTGTGTGGPGYSIKDDEVTGAYDRGVVAMANAGPDTAGSQFFIVHGTTVDQMLGKDYAIFGRVDEEGMQVIDEIAEVEVTANPTGEPSLPTEMVRIERMTLEER